MLEPRLVQTAEKVMMKLPTTGFGQIWAAGTARGRDRAVVWRDLKKKMAKRSRMVIVNIFKIKHMNMNMNMNELPACAGSSKLNFVVSKLNSTNLNLIFIFIYFILETITNNRSYF